MQTRDQSFPRTRSRTFSEILPARDDFGSAIPDRADPRVQPLAALKLSPEPKVGHLDLAALVEQDVFEFEVAVHDALAVQVGDPEHELAEDLPRLGRREATLLDEVVKQFAAGAQFRHEVDRRFRRDQLVQRQDVRVSQPTVVVDLASEEREGGRGIRRTLRWQESGHPYIVNAGFYESRIVRRN